VSRPTIRGTGLLAVALLATTCGTAPGAPSAVATASLLAPASEAASDIPRPSPVGTSAIVVDETLIDHLPTEVDGIAVVGDPGTAGSIATDPDLAAHASAIAVAYAISPGASVADDLAVISVVQLRPSVFDPDFFRSWRDSYDAAACAAAGGVSGNAEAEFGARHGYIGSCTAGAHTYHVYLEGANVIVSITSVGPRRLGEQVVAGLRE
jgi:hypothetical protein